MYCNHCGNQNDTDSKFCHKCGNKLQFSSEQNRAENILFVPEKKSHTLRNILLTIVVVGVLFFILILVANSESNTSNPVPPADTSTTADSTISDNWEKFTSVEHNFSIDFPNYPSTERIAPVTSGGYTYSGTQYVTSTSNDQDIFLAQGVDYSISPIDYDNKTGLEGMLNYLSKSEDYKITDSYFSKFKGFYALEFLGNFENGNYSIKGILFIRDDLSKIKSFFLMVASKDNDNLDNLYNNFINSFTFTD